MEKIKLFVAVVWIMNCSYFCTRNPVSNDESFADQVTLTRVEVTPEGAILANSGTQHFSSKAIYSDGTSQDLTDESIWSTSPGTAGSISSTGLFGADNANMGTEIVTATYQGNQGQATVIVKVTPSEMIYISEGYFSMGSREGSSAEQPIHSVYLDAYYIDKYEVTNGQYASYLNEALTDGHLQIDNSWTVDTEGEPLLVLSYAQISYTGQHFVVDNGKENYPAIWVTWFGATAYARHHGLRLPTEAEWEKAARGTDGRKFPWGNTDPTSSLCNFNYNEESSTPVGHYSPAGDSPYGCSDMAGNVAEWCADWYDSDYYSTSTISNPGGPSSGGYRVVRGGFWFSYWGAVRSARRFRDRPNHWCTPYGFRCAKTPINTD